ncbi:MAG: hypothetical protein PHU73_05510, partial [Patescibacteria group bacterium]|nr:hypothetical protein [Patescibacteria group bacterium]
MNTRRLRIKALIFSFGILAIVLIVRHAVGDRIKDLSAARGITQAIGAGAQTLQNSNSSYTFIKHYRIEDLSAAWGIAQTKDGGYVFTGQAKYDKPSVYDEDAFITKIDAKGNHQWTK